MCCSKRIVSYVSHDLMWPITHVCIILIQTITKGIPLVIILGTINDFKTWPDTVYDVLGNGNTQTASITKGCAFQPCDLHKAKFWAVSDVSWLPGMLKLAKSFPSGKTNWFFSEYFRIFWLLKPAIKWFPYPDYVAQ